MELNLLLTAVVFVSGLLMRNQVSGGYYLGYYANYNVAIDMVHKYGEFVH